MGEYQALQQSVRRKVTLSQLNAVIARLNHYIDIATNIEGTLGKLGVLVVKKNTVCNLGNPCHIASATNMEGMQGKLGVLVVKAQSEEWGLYFVQSTLH
jgi:hypothetical protein